MDRNSVGFVDDAAGPVHVLVVDDDRNVTESMTDTLRPHGFDVTTAESCAAARTALRDRAFDVVLLDLLLPDGNGLELLDDRRRANGADFYVITGHATVLTAVTALKRGARDYFTKPVDPFLLASELREFRRTRAQQSRLRVAPVDGGRPPGVGALIGGSPAIQEVLAQVASVAGTDVSVLLHGESGTGKEMLARLIHDSSRRRDGPFVPLRCGAVGQEQVEAELFGSDLAAPAGGASRLGVLERAQRGTLFLDEVSEMTPALQKQLLRALEAGSFRRMNGTRPLPIDVRIVASTSARPAELTERRMVRADLFFRLSAFSIRVPTLRERAGDVASLATHFLARLNREFETGKAWSPDALEQLAQRDWTGNVRELENAVRRAYILSEESLTAEQAVPDALPAASGEAAPSPFVPGISIEDAERVLILATLEHVKDDKPEAAKLLGISLRTLYNRLSAYRDGAS